MSERSMQPVAVHELRGARYRVVLSEGGGGRSEADGLALNRWGGDRLADAQGWMFYLRDVDSGELWSATPQPFADPQDDDVLEVGGATACFARSRHGIASRLQLAVHPELPQETRSLELHNRSGDTRRLQLTALLDVALAPAEADLGHPAFLKLFVQTRCVGDGVLLAQRRARAQGERWPLMFLRLDGAPVTAWDSDRLRVLGRGGSPARPALALAGTVGNVLDPCFCLQTELVLAPGERRSLCYTLGIAADPAPLLALPDAIHRAAELPASPARTYRGEFSPDGREYRLSLPWNGDRLGLPPLPWVNVLANPGFGCIVSETGAGTSWARNSQANRLTPWSNDPVSDPHADALWLRDEDDGSGWSPLPGPRPAPVDYSVAHGHGYSRYHCSWRQLDQRTTVFVAAEAPLRVTLLELRNDSAQVRRLSLFSLQTLVLGTQPPPPGRLCSAQRGELLVAWNPKAGDFADGLVFAFAAAPATIPIRSCRSRAAALGRWGRPDAPRLLNLQQLDDVDGDEACFAQQLQLQLAPGETLRLGLVLGEATSESQLQALHHRYGSVAALESELAAVTAAWRERLDGLEVSTPSPELDRLVNGWLPYQTLACRIWGRTAFYQSGGAYGYRDQLQDAGNLSLLWPQRTREQILLHAAHQFVEGDVLHWWHPEPIGRGLRTRFADDLLWLPWVAARYVDASGDHALFDEQAPFLTAPALQVGEDEVYLRPQPAGLSASVWEHACRAIDRSLAAGEHGLPLMGCGDWNDGMNRIGREGRGESVWMGLFLAQILARYAPLAEARRETARAQAYRARHAHLVTALEQAGWDGGWYRRAYYDDGTPLGSANDAECRIDGLVQAWSVLSGAVNPQRAAQAMHEAEAQLLDKTHGLLRLLTPPFVDTPHDPGYIRGYLAGVRENGGQYTHAACWFVAALARLGLRNRALEVLEMIGPGWHTRDAARQQIYKVEPYVIAADIYSVEPHAGRGGWTWYTGSAGWAWQVAVQEILGLRVEGGDTLVLAPCIPDHWPEYRLRYQLPGRATVYEVEVHNPQRCSARIVAATLDGQALHIDAGPLRVPLQRDATRRTLRVVLGA